MSEVKRDVCHGCVSLPRDIHCPVCDPDIGWRKELNAQRLRADTAEAEVERLTKSLTQSLSRHADTGVELAVAEQRIVEQHELLREVQKVARKQAWAQGYPALFAKVDAALNPNPEAESHE